MRTSLHVHPALTEELPHESEARLTKLVRELGATPDAFRVFVGPGLRGLRARVELRTSSGRRHRFVSNAPSGRELVSRLEERLRRTLHIAPRDGEIA